MAILISPFMFTKISPKNPFLHRNQSKKYGYVSREFFPLAQVYC